MVLWLLRESAYFWDFLEAAEGVFWLPVLTARDEPFFYRGVRDSDNFLSTMEFRTFVPNEGVACWVITGGGCKVFEGCAFNGMAACWSCAPATPPLSCALEDLLPI